MTVRAVIWDFGGVFTSSPFVAFARYEAEHGLPKDFIRGVNATDPDTNAWAKLERSEIDAETFDVLFSEESTRLGNTVGGPRCTGAARWRCAAGNGLGADDMSRKTQMCLHYE